MKPRYANTWYSEIPVGQLRQEIQALYEEVGKLSDVGSGGGESSVDLSKYLPLTGGNITGSLGINTASPQRRFEVVQDATNATDGMVVRSANIAGQLWAGTGGFVIDSRTADLSGGGSLQLWTDGTARLTISSAGQTNITGSPTLGAAGTTTTSAVRADRTITAGNGLSGGGNLTANRTITLGTPTSITGSSTNSVTTTSHTHAVSSLSAGVITSGTLPVSRGGTGATTHTSGNFLRGAGTGAITSRTPAQVRSDIGAAPVTYPVGTVAMGTGTTVITSAYVGRVTYLTNTAARTLQIPADSTYNAPIGSVVRLAYGSMFSVTISAASGVTLIRGSSPPILSRDGSGHSGVSATAILWKVAANVWAIQV